MWEEPALFVPVSIMLLQLPVLYGFFKRPESPLSRLALIALVIIDLGSFGWFTQWHYESHSPVDFTPPPHAARYRQLLLPLHQRILPVRGQIGTVDELPPNLSGMWEIPSASGYLNFVTDRFYKFFTMPDGGFILEDWSSSDNRVTDIASIRYVFCAKDDTRFPLPTDSVRWRKVEEIGKSTVVYENMRALPKVWLVNEVKVLPAEAVLKAARTSEIDGVKSFDPRQTALVEEPCDIGPAAQGSPGSAKISSMTSNTVEIDTQSSRTSFLVLSDTFNPGWNVYIDGVKAKILRTDYIFRGVVIPQGKHRVFFSFEPMSLVIGKGVCLASLLALLGVYLFMARRERRSLQEAETSKS